MLFALCAFKLPLLKFWEPVSIHNIYNVPLGAGASSGGPEGRSCESIMNAKLGQNRFWHCHENRLIKTI